MCTGIGPTCVDFSEFGSTNSENRFAFFLLNSAAQQDKCKWGRLKLATFDEKRAITQKR